MQQTDPTTIAAAPAAGRRAAVAGLVAVATILVVCFGVLIGAARGAAGHQAPAAESIRR